MPNFPTYDAPQVNERPLETPYSNVAPGPEAFGAGVGKAMEGLGAQGIALYKQEKEKADNAAVDSAMSAYQDAADAESMRYHALKERDAAEQAVPTGDAIDKAGKEAMGKLTSGQQEKAQNRYNALRRGYHNNIEAHAADETDKAQVTDFAASQGTTLRTLATMYKNNDVAARARLEIMDQQEESTRSFYKARGYSDAAVDDKVGEFRGQAAAAVLDSMLSEHPGEQVDINAAKAYFTAHTDVLGKHTEEFAKKIAGFVDKDAVTKQSLEIIKGATDEKTGWVDYNKALSAAEALPDSPQKAVVLSHVGSLLQEHQRAKDGEIDQHYQAAYSQYVKNHSLNDVDPKEKLWLQDHAPGKWDSLFKEDKQNSRVKKEDKQLIIQEAKLRFSYMTGEQQRTLDIDKEFPELGSDGKLAIRNEQTKAQETYKKGDEPKLDEFRGIVKAEVEKVFPADSDKTRRGEIVEYMVSWREKQLAEHPDRIPTRKEVNAAIADKLLYGDQRKGTYFGQFNPNKYKYEVPPGEEGEFVPFQASEQPYGPNKAAAPQAAAPAAPAKKEPTRTVNGETRVWRNGKWVKP